MDVIVVVAHGIVAGDALVGIVVGAVGATGHQALDAGLPVGVVVVGLADPAVGQILAIYTVAEGAKGAELPCEEVVLGVIALSAGKEGAVVGQKPVSSIVVVTIGAACAAKGAVLAGILGVEVTGHADAGIGG